VNYELMVRMESPEVASAANALFEECRKLSREVRKESWLNQRSLWTRLQQRFAHFVMARLDPWVALSQWQALPD
jgi:phosphatidylserine/phosphatidylglycerophosphate/cardiolipin synthase-like enzyme